VTGVGGGRGGGQQKSRLVKTEEEEEEEEKLRQYELGQEIIIQYFEAYHRTDMV